MSLVTRNDNTFVSGSLWIVATNFCTDGFITISGYLNNNAVRLVIQKEWGNGNGSTEKRNENKRLL